MGEQVAVSIQSLNGRILRSFAVKGTGAMQEFKLGNLRVNAGGTYIVTVKSSAHAGSSAMLLRKVID